MYVFRILPGEVTLKESKESPVSLERALEKTLNAARELSSEEVAIDDADNRILAEDVLSDTDMPPFSKSAMDGFACRRADLRENLEIVGEVAAGQMSPVVVGPGQCVRIMTGAPVPAGADFVVMVEHTRMLDDGTLSVTIPAGRDNICRPGEDIRRGEVVAKKGTRILAAHVAVLAAAGGATVKVYRRPTVGVIATGSELVEPGQPIEGAKIRNSNSLQLMAQIREMGAIPVYYGIAADTLDSIGQMASRAKAQCDVVAISGGVSMGKYDVVPDALAAAGFSFEYSGVAMQPGKPTMFGTSADNRWCFGFPGNPVSAYVAFEFLAKPFLYRLMGYHYQPRMIPAMLMEALERKKTARTSSFPVRFTEPGLVALMEYHGSAHIGAFSDADGIITVPQGVARLEKGTVVYVRCL